MQKSWIAARSDGKRGTGTQSDPFDATDLDVLMRDSSRIPPAPNVEINFIPGGVFFTDPFARGWNLHPRWVFNGNGASVWARGSGQNHSGYYDVIGGPPSNSGVVIRDLNIDCQWMQVQKCCQPVGNGERNVALNGIAALGSNSLVERCRVTNFYGSAAGGKEAGGIVIGGPSVSNVKARFNRVEMPAGNYNNGINVWALTGNATQPLVDATLEENTIIGTRAGIGWQLQSAINAGGVHNLRAFKNHVFDCNQLIYNDTGDTVDWVIEKNDAARTEMAVMLAQSDAMGLKRGIRVIDNDLNCCNRGSGALAGVAFINGHSNDLYVAGNRITYDGSAKGSTSFATFFCFNMDRAFFIDNISDAPLVTPAAQGSRLIFSGNRRPDGSIIDPVLADNF